MEFDLPTTKDQMYAVLAELFNHYRVRKEGFEETELQELALERLDVNLETDQELMDKAEDLLAPDHEREIKKYKADLIYLIWFSFAF